MNSGRDRRCNQQKHLKRGRRWWFWSNQGGGERQRYTTVSWVVVIVLSRSVVEVVCWDDDDSDCGCWWCFVGRYCPKWDCCNDGGDVDDDVKTVWCGTKLFACHVSTTSLYSCYLPIHKINRNGTTPYHTSFFFFLLIKSNVMI